MTPIDLIVAALRVDAEPERWHADVAAARADLDDVAVTALALGLAPLMHYRLEQWGRPLPNAQAQAKLAFARQAEVARQAARLAQLSELLGAVRVTPIVLKGAYLAECVYPAAGLRPMNDIDLLFRPGDLPAVAQALRGLGYRSKEKSVDQGPGITKHISTFKRAGEGATPNPYLSADGSRMVEPHRSLEEAWFGLRCDITPGMWERSQPVVLAGRAARCLAPADTLLHLCVHLAFHLIMGSPSFVQLADVAVVADRVSIDWDDFTSRARDLGAAGYAYAAARLAVRALAARIPPEVLSSLRAAAPARVRATAEGLSVGDMMRRTQRAPLRTVAQRLRRGAADRAETARWAHSQREWLRIWWTLVDVARTDTWKMIFD